MFQFINRLNLDRIFMCVGFGLAGVAAYVVWTEEAPLVSSSQLSQMKGAHLQTVQVYDMGKIEAGSSLRLECVVAPSGEITYGKVKFVNTTGELRDAVMMDKDHKKLTETCAKLGA